MEFSGAGGLPVEPPDYLPKLEKSNRGISSPVDIFHRTVKILEPTECLKLISPDLIADYAMARYYLICAQLELSSMATVGQKKGKIADETEFYITSFAEAMLKMQKNVLATWTPIWDIVSRNCEKLTINPEQDLIFSLASNRQRKKPKGDPPDEIYGYPEAPGQPAEPGEVQPSD